MKKSKILISFLLVIIAALSVFALAACNSGDDNNQNNQPEITPSGSEVVEEITKYDGAVNVTCTCDYSVGENVITGTVNALLYAEGEPVKDETSGEIDCSSVVINADITGSFVGGDQTKPLNVYIRMANDTLTLYTLKSGETSVYQKVEYANISDLINENMSGGGAPDAYGVLVEGEALSMYGLIQTLLSADGVFSGEMLNNILDACLKVEKVDGGFSLTFDLIDYVNYNIDEILGIMDTVNNKTTIGEVYKSDDFKKWFELTYKGVTAKELYDAIIEIAEATDDNELLMVVYTIPEPSEEQSMYDWIKSILDTDFAVTNGKIGDINLFTLLDVTTDSFNQMKQSLSDAKTELSKNTLKVGAIVKSAKVTGLTVNVCLPNVTVDTDGQLSSVEVKVNAVLNFEEQKDAQFFDVSGLQTDSAQ